MQTPDPVRDSALDWTWLHKGPSENTGERREPGRCLEGWKGAEVLFTHNAVILKEICLLIR